MEEASEHTSLSLRYCKDRWGHSWYRKSNNIHQQIYEVMFSWEICPRSTSMMIVLNSQRLYISYTISWWQSHWGYGSPQTNDRPMLTQQALQPVGQTQGVKERFCNVFNKMQRIPESSKDSIKTEVSLSGLAGGLLQDRSGSWWQYSRSGCHLGTRRLVTCHRGCSRFW